MVENGELVKREPAGELSYAPANNPQYAVGFDGMSIAPFADNVRKVLAEPVDPNDVETKPDGIIYLPGIFYRDRLTKAFGVGGWAIAARGPVKTRSQGGGELVIWPGALFCLGRFVSEAVGQCVYYPANKGMTYADAVEGAKTDCITRCCKDLSIARELWDPGWRTEWQSKYAHQETNSKGDRVWKRKSRESKLNGSASASSAAPSSRPVPTTVVAAPAVVPANDARGPTDDGEVIADDTVDEMIALVKRMQWKQGFARMWLKGRFAVEEPGSLTEEQGWTAVALLSALAGGGDDLYAKVLAAKVAEGRCQP